MEAPLPTNEKQRLEALRSLDLLDSKAESEFDELTALAAQICNVPVALVSLVDENRQWFKSKVGLEVDETSREVAFCAHSILNPEQIMEIPDAHLDKRFADNPLVTEDPKIRFYAGAPLTTSSGHTLGTLCVLDYNPRSLTDSQKTALDMLRLLTVQQIELRHGYKTLKSSQGMLSVKNSQLKTEVEETAISLEQEVGLRVESEILSRRILDMALDGVISVDQAGKVIYWNPKAELIFGYSARYAQGASLLDLVVEPREHNAIQARLNEFLNQGIKSIKPDRFEMMAVRFDGQRIPIEVAVIALQRYGEYVFTGFVRDLTEKNKYLEELRVSAITFNSQEGIIITDGENKILRVNKAFGEITGYSSEDVVGTSPELLRSDQQDKSFYAAIWKAVEEHDGWEGEVWGRRKNGDGVPLHLTITAIKDAQGLASNYVLAFSDITRNKKDADEIYNLAFFDPLTGLPNRRLLMDRLFQAVANSRRTDQKAALLFLDLDNFKSLNDTLGHDFGDLLLKQTAQRLKHSLRAEDTVARIGGDEFVIILQNLGEEGLDAPAQTEAVANKILAALNQPYSLHDHECFSSASIGATLFESSAVEVDELLRQADIAMYQAKKSGRNMLRFFDPQMQENITQRANLENALHNAVEKKQFQLYYQLQVDNKNQPIGAEALIRWQHPVLGTVPPQDFIPLAEDSGLIVPIGRWVIETACEQIRCWQDNPRTADLTVAVNISPRQFYQANFVDEVLECLAETGIDSGALKLELTEGLILDDVNEAIVKMNELRRAGVHFSLDDFGTGYSSLSYLTQLPLSQLKIDQSFVRNIGVNDSDSIIIKTIIGMSKSLGFEVVAEGVESQHQYDFLEALGCQLFQGYLFSRPVTVGEFEGLL
ncbi:MAG: EAL domain-containing protein [Porticoccaceae bacterium]|nr:EAL domain-containing protein [Porticoccaceae bacterium]